MSNTHRDKLAEEYCLSKAKHSATINDALNLGGAFKDGFDLGERSLKVMALVEALRKIAEGISPLGGITSPDGIRRIIATKALKQWEAGDD